MEENAKDDELSAVRSTDRPRVRRGSSDVEASIFDATERLLAEVPFRELTVAQILKGAGISRATFYFYFSSKDAVLVGLMAKVMDQMSTIVSDFVEGTGANGSARDALRRSIEAGARLWAEHRHVMRAAQEHWHAVPEVRDLWLRINAGFKDDFAREIARERAAGTAPPGVPEGQLAAMLVWSSGQLMFVAGLGVDADLPGEHALVEPLAAMWVDAIYGDGSAPAS